MTAPETPCYHGYDEPNGNVLHRIRVFTPKADPVAKTNSPNVGGPTCPEPAGLCREVNHAP